MSNDAGEKSHAEAEVAAITVVQRPREGGGAEMREREAYQEVVYSKNETEQNRNADEER